MKCTNMKVNLKFQLQRQNEINNLLLIIGSGTSVHFAPSIFGIHRLY